MADTSHRLAYIFTNTLSPNGEIRYKAEYELARLLEEPGKAIYNGFE